MFYETRTSWMLYPFNGWLSTFSQCFPFQKSLHGARLPSPRHYFHNAIPLGVDGSLLHLTVWQIVKRCLCDAINAARYHVLCTADFLVIKAELLRILILDELDVFDKTIKKYSIIIFKYFHWVSTWTFKSVFVCFMSHPIIYEIIRVMSRLEPGTSLKQEAQRATSRAPEYNVPLFEGLARAAILFFRSVLKTHAKVEDVGILLSIKFHWILFSGFRGGVKNVSANQRQGLPSCFSNRPEKHKLGKGRWDLASCPVSLNSV